jgi:hypothetical protein
MSHVQCLINNNYNNYTIDNSDDDNEGWVSGSLGIFFLYSSYIYIDLNHFFTGKRQNISSTNTMSKSRTTSKKSMRVGQGIRN